MYDELDQLFDQLRDQRPPVPFKPAEAVRRRGRQRAHRHAVSAGVAVLAVTGLGAGGFAVTIGQPEPAPVPPIGGPVATSGLPTGGQQPQPTTPGPSRLAPSPTEIPGRWLLTAGDLGPDGGWTETTSELFESDPPWFWGDLCGEYRLADYLSLQLRVDLRTVSWESPDRRPVPRIDQMVELFDRAESSATNLDDVRAITGRCSQTPEPRGEGPAGTAYDVVREGFTGDESMLIRMAQYYFAGETIAPVPHQRYAAVIRVDRAVTTLISDDDQLLREVAPAAAAKLRG